MIEHGFDRILQIMADWIGVQGEIKTEFNDDFVDSTLTGQDVLALVQAWQAGAMSFETLFWNLKQGELIEDDTTPEDEQAKIKLAGLPPAPSAATAV